MLLFKRHFNDPLFFGRIMNTEFDYLITKLGDAQFETEPFKYLIIDNFLSEDHFRKIISSPEVARPCATDTSQLIEDLHDTGYRVQPFPGCVTSIRDYLRQYKKGLERKESVLTEGFGLTMRLQHFTTPTLARLVDFLNSPAFKQALEGKFCVSGDSYVETAVQKYLQGYEISPHPDIRKKALTYMLNINSSKVSEKADIHTRLMKLKPQWQYIYDFWRYNPDIDRCWVPWDWCEVELQTTKNNSIILFAPSNDTLHAVKLNYNHLEFQRTQVYGNVWYHETPAIRHLEHRELDLARLARPLNPGLSTKIYKKIKGMLGHRRGYVGN